MRFLLVAILFVLAVAAFTAVIKFGYQSSLETELSHLSKTALNDAGLPGVEIDFDHHNAILSGYVESSEQRDQALQVVSKAVPIAVLPPSEEVAIAIKPTLPPKLLLIRTSAGKEVKLTGILSVSGEANRTLLGSRLHSIDEVNSVDNQIALDPMRLPFPKTAEFASLAEGLLKHPGEVRLSYDQDRLSLKGEVPNIGLKESLLELAELIAPEAIDEAIIVSAPIDTKQPSQFSLTRNRFGISVSGTVGSQEDREALMSLLSKPGDSIRVTEKLILDEEVEAGVWESNASEILPIILETIQGELTAEFTPERVRIVGRVEDKDGRKKILSVLNPHSKANHGPQLLMEVEVSNQSPQGPPVQLLAVFKKKQLSLTGNVPTTSFADELAASLEEQESEIVLENNLEETPNSPGKEWVPQLSELLMELERRTEKAKVSIKGNSIHLEGTTLQPADRQLIQNLLVNILPASFSIENELAQEEETFPTPKLLPEDRTKLGEDLKQLAIYFGSNSEVVRDDELEKIEKISVIIKDAGVPLALQVTGFADNVGNAAYNRELSLRRADAVVSLLVGQGITKDTMSTESVGEDVSNVSRSDRWKARRVEVSLIEESSTPPEDETPGSEP